MGPEEQYHTLFKNKQILTILARYDAKINEKKNRPLHVFLNNYPRGGTGAFEVSLRFLKDGLATELLRETCKGGQFFSDHT